MSEKEGFVASMASTHSQSSSFKNTICLFDWWLTKTETQFHGKKGLGVAGITSRQKAVRVFSSAPIAKRYDVFTVETSDDVCIVLKSLINAQRTAQNGFPSQVEKAFMFGFPTDWEQHAEKYCGEDSKTEETPKKKNHVSHEDRKETEVRKGQSLEVSENFATDPSNAFNLNGNAADETEGTDLASTGTTRYSVRLKNLEGGKKKFTSSCSLNNERSVSTMPLLEETPKKKKHVSQEDKKAIEVLKVESHGVSENTATNPSNVSNLKRNAAGGTKGGGTVLYLSSDELQERVVANMAEKQHDVQASNSKQGHKSKNAKTKDVQEADAKEENLVGKKAKRKISLTVPETDAKEESTAGKKAKKKISLVERETDAKEKSTDKKKIKRKSITKEKGIRGAQEEKTVKHIVSPECLSVGRSRSGRLLLPTLEFWRNQMLVYDMDGKVSGIQDDQAVQVPARGSVSKPHKKRKQ